MDIQAISVIVADDHKTSRDIVVELLRSEGVRDIRQADDGGEAYKLVCARTPDILILDLEMPYDGVRTLRQIRTAPDSPNRELPVLMMTAYCTKARIEAMRDAGTTEIVAKPLTGAALMGRLRSMLRYPRPFIDLTCYVGPDRRRLALGDYPGPFRRSTDSPVFEIA